MNQINIQVIVFVLLIAFSGISWLLRKLKEQAEIKRAKDEHQRRIEEMLRTGRDPLTGEPAVAVTVAQTQSAGPAAPVLPPALPPDHSAQQREFAQRRREQLRQLRERLAGRPAAPQPPSVPVPASPYPGPVAPDPWRGPMPGVPSRSPAPPRQQPTPPLRQKPKKAKRPAPQQATAPRPAPAVPHSENGDADRRRATFERAIADTTEPAASTRAPIAGGIPGVQRQPLPLAVAYIPRGPDGWRQAFIASEILGQPIAIRGPATEEIK